jgi:hypothetical protein
LDETTYYKAKQVVSAAEADPETFGDLPARMDETRNVSGAHREMKRRKEGKGRHPVFKKMAHRKPNREVERAVHALSGICFVLEQVPVDELDAKKTREWAASLKKHAVSINSFARKINGKVR